jgi:hypothetical protein
MAAENAGYRSRKEKRRKIVLGRLSLPAKPDISLSNPDLRREFEDIGTRPAELDEEAVSTAGTVRSAPQSSALTYNEREPPETLARSSCCEIYSMKLAAPKWSPVD